MDYDGRDEVIGGNLIDDDGSIIWFGYPMNWILDITTYVDHLDAIAIGDFRTDRPGLEWIVTEEDWVGSSDEWNTTLISYNPSVPVTSILWRTETTLFPQPKYPAHYKEPQAICAGNYDPARSYSEIWINSALCRDDSPDTSQHPWLYDAYGLYFKDYKTGDVLPGSSTSDYFNQHPHSYNKRGLEAVWTVDWDGSEKDYIAGIARHFKGNVGVFDAVKGSSVWHTGTDGDANYSSVRAQFIYMADIAGDPREEIIICDSTASGPYIRIFWNTSPNTNKPKMNKWHDPLYTRLKQNWNYYSPGSYTQPMPAKLDIHVFLEGPYDPDADAMDIDLYNVGHIPLQSPHSEDPSTASTIPENAVDWVLLQLRETVSGSAVFSRSLILKSDGQIVDYDGASPVPLHVARGQYYLILKHRNHLAIMTAGPERLSPDSTTSIDFRSDSTEAYNEGVKRLETGVYGMYAGDGNGNGEVQNDDKNDVWWPYVGKGGYYAGDYNLNGEVQNDDKNDLWWTNVGRGSAVP